MVLTTQEKQELKAYVQSLDYDSLLDRQQKINHRLTQVSVPDVNSYKKSKPSGGAIPFEPKTDVHWDFILKELQWLSTDFQGERKRQISLAKKTANSIKAYHDNRQKRIMKQMADLELKKKKTAKSLANKVVKGWWNGKIERVIAYKQKVDADLVRKKGMDRHLVFLVKQTERYTDLLNQQLINSGECMGDDFDEHNLTIEQVLQDKELQNQLTKRSRNKRTRHMDYQSLADRLGNKGEHEFYGESTEEESLAGHETDTSADWDEEYIDDDVHDEVDDETTLIEAEQMDADSPDALRRELELLEEEKEINIETLLRRLEEERDNLIMGNDNDEKSCHVANEPHPKKVRFSEDITKTANYPGTANDGNVADDDADMSDVDDFEDEGVNNDEDDEEFSSNPMDCIDDETTLEAELRLKPEISAEDEIALLNKEAEMSVEELRAMYAGAGVQSLGQAQHVNQDDGDDDDNDDGDEDDEEFSSNPMDCIDDETTLEAELRLKPEISAEDEIALLNKEAEMSVEELRAMYAGAGVQSLGQAQHVNQDDGDDDDNDDGDEDDEEFSSNPMDCIDDETTLEAELRLKPEISAEDEIALLNKEAEMSVEELRAMYAGAGVQSLGQAQHVNQDDGDDDDNDDGDEDDEEFSSNPMDCIDDETTLEAELRLKPEISAEDEIALLNKEAEMSVEELRAMYAGAGVQSLSQAQHMNQDDDGDDDDDEKMDSGAESDGNKNKETKREDSYKRKHDSDEDIGANAMKSLELADAKARNTAVSRPYLLASWVKLRKYQQIGLNWLVSIQTRRLNGILADEMGLGKTLQTISLLSYLASYKGIWGPHLIIVPTSCIVNWEVEIKRFCPALKVLCYYGSAKRRKELRQGWTKTNWHHVVITSYQLAVQDAFAFKRKKWYYLVLDEAHNIKNFQSQRWQTLVNFNTQRRLLLTGTPLQNNLMELWSLLHFLMPHVFRSRKEFSYWFSNPMNNIIEGNTSKNDDLIGRLHGIIRPFVLRRLKKDVETQMPGKYEHIVKCHLSRRQMFLYEEFMARSSTKMALQKGGNYMGMMNVLMQLRKVCNHPDLFESRSIITPFCSDRLSIVTASSVVNALDQDQPLQTLSNSVLTPLWSNGSGQPSFQESLSQSAYIAQRRKQLKVDKQTLKSHFEKGSESKFHSDTNISPGLSRLLNVIQTKLTDEHDQKSELHCSLNDSRCESQAFAYPFDLQQIAMIETNKVKYSSLEDCTCQEIASTPSDLLMMRKRQEEAINSTTSDLEKNFVFYVPRAGSDKPILFPKRLADIDEQSLSHHLGKYVSLNSVDSNTLFFPDKKLIQFDAGKLQILSELLRNLKQDKHRVLIFTQMSKMLDILEAFLNLNGHTYLRLDGATSVDQRQRLMDRFNGDENIFCFILSTRSGGLGINLTGADTVVFYDSDWNPAMDAQAQDRAHRIGQTRDVHIYRLVTEHSIEENILVKAKQKQQLDFLVMDEGKFHAAPDSTKESDMEEDQSNSFDITSKGGLRNILGISDERESEEEGLESKELPEENVESAMAAFEDEDDVLAMKGAQQEAKQELEEFDDNIQIVKNDEGSQESQDESQDETVPATKKGTSLDPEVASQEDQAEDLEKEFAAWQSQVGIDRASIDASLNPVERYALRYKEDIDPFYSMWYLSEQQRIQELESSQEEWDIEEIETLKAEEELYAIENGDLLATMPEPVDLLRQRDLYFREKSRLNANKKRRRLTGQNWKVEIDGKSKLPFYYNIDTGEATWFKPQVIVELEEYENASTLFWNAMPTKPLLRIMEYLIPYPERMVCAQTCTQWRRAAQDISFVRHVYPVEMGALTMDPNKMHPYHYRTISEALQDALPGDNIELGDGHYWINEDVLDFHVPVKLIGDEKDPSHVVIELSGELRWSGSGGYIEGVTFRRPRMNDKSDTKPMLLVQTNGKLSIKHGSFEGAREKVTEGIEEEVSGCGIEVHGKLDLQDVVVTKSNGHGIVCSEYAELNMSHCRLVGNAGQAIRAMNEGKQKITEQECEFRENGSTD